MRDSILLVYQGVEQGLLRATFATFGQPLEDNGTSLSLYFLTKPPQEEERRTSVLFDHHHNHLRFGMFCAECDDGTDLDDGTECDDGIICDMGTGGGAGLEQSQAQHW